MDSPGRMPVGEERVNMTHTVGGRRRELSWVLCRWCKQLILRAGHRQQSHLCAACGLRTPPGSR